VVGEPQGDEEDTGGKGKDKGKDKGKADDGGSEKGEGEISGPLWPPQSDTELVLVVDTTAMNVDAAAELLAEAKDCDETKGDDEAKDGVVEEEKSADTVNDAECVTNVDVVVCLQLDTESVSESLSIAPAEPEADADVPGSPSEAIAEKKSPDEEKVSDDSQSKVTASAPFSADAAALGQDDTKQAPTAMLTLEEEVAPGISEEGPVLALSPLCTEFVGSDRFSVPLGTKKIFRIHTESPQGHCACFSSSASLKLLDIATARRELFGTNVVEAEGVMGPYGVCSWNVAARYKFLLGATNEDGGDEKSAEVEAGEQDGATKPAQLVSAWIQLFDQDLAPFVQLFTVNNDTGETVSHPDIQTEWLSLTPNSHGYSVVVVARSGTRQLPPCRWRLCVGSDGLISELEKQPWSNAQIFSDSYVPNRQCALFRDVLRQEPATEDASGAAGVSLRLSTSWPDARLKLSVFNCPVKVTGATELQPCEEIITVRGRGSVQLLGLPLSRHALPTVEEDTGGKKGKDKGKGKTVDAEMLPEQCIVEAVLDTETWEVPAELRSVLPFVQPKLATPESDEATAEEKDDALTAAESEPEPEPVLTWTLQTVSNGPLQLHHDPEKQAKEIAVRQQWNFEDPTRPNQAKASRLRFLGRADEADALLGSGDSKGGKKDKKDKKDKKAKKGKDDNEDDPRAAFKAARRERLRLVGRAAVTQPVHDGMEAIVLTDEDHEQRAQKLQARLAADKHRHETVLQVRADQAAARTAEMEQHRSDLLDWRTRIIDERNEIFAKREAWRLEQVAAREAMLAAKAAELEAGAEAN